MEEYNQEPPRRVEKKKTLTRPPEEKRVAKSQTTEVALYGI
jgi:hypothetical protein